MSDSTYRHRGRQPAEWVDTGRILVRTERPSHCRSRPDAAPSLPARAKRWWRAHLTPGTDSGAELWQHALFFAPDAAGTGLHPAARQCLEWRDTH